MRLVLASASPRRAELLRAAGFEFETRVVDVDERVRKDERAAELRAPPGGGEVGGSDGAAEPGEPGADADSDCEEIVVIAADTAVVVDGEILGKPHDDEDAACDAATAFRHAARGDDRRQSAQGPDERNRVETTACIARALSDEDVAWYVASGEGSGQGRGYAIQGLASRFIPRIDGSYSNVVGYPGLHVRPATIGRG